MKNSILLFFIISLLVGCNTEPFNLVKIQGSRIPISNDIAPNKSFKKIVQPYTDTLDVEMNTVLGFTEINLTKTDGALESSLGNLMADICYEKANPIFLSKHGKPIDFALFNYGGMRSGIPKGIITYRDAYNLMPFENRLVVVELSSQKLKELFNYLISQNKAHPISKQVKITHSPYKTELTIHNKPINYSKTYRVLTSDYLQKGGDQMTFFKDPVNLFQLDYKIRNAIIDYFKEKDSIFVKLDGRFERNEL